MARLFSEIAHNRLMYNVFYPYFAPYFSLLSHRNHQPKTFIAGEGKIFLTANYTWLISSTEQEKSLSEFSDRLVVLFQLYHPCGGHLKFKEITQQEPLQLQG